jgi:hypothetical protein
MVSQAVGAALGRLIRNLRNPRWVIAEVAKQAFSIIVVAPTGRKVRAHLKKHIHHDDGHIADVHEDEHGHEYIVVHGKVYWFDPQTDSWYETERHHG